MQYISPIRFFEQFDMPSEEWSDIKKMKKYINLEFQLSEIGIISIDGHEYNKHDLLQLLAQEDYKVQLHFHIQIWNNKPFLDLLEYRTVELKMLSDILAFNNDPTFCQFVSPYFAKPFRNVSNYLLADLLLSDLYVFVKAQSYISIVNAEVAYESFVNYFENALYVLRNINSTNWKRRLPEIRRWAPRDWALVLNNLPDYLYGYKEQIAECLTHLLFIMQYDDKTMCYSISSWLAELKIDSQEIAETIQENHLVYKSAFEPAYLDDIPQKKRRFSLPLRKTLIYSWLIVIVFIFYFMARHVDDPRSKKSMYYISSPTSFGIKEIQNDTLSISKDLVYNDVTYFDIATLFQKAYDGQKIESLDPIDSKEYGVLPIYFNVFDGQDKYLEPIEIKNNTNRNLVFVYFEQARIRGLIIPMKGAVYIKPLECKNIYFFIDSLDIAADSSNNRTRLEYFLSIHKIIFAMNGAQSIAMSVNFPKTMSYSNDYFNYSLLTNSITSIQSSMTIEINKSADKYRFSIKGNKLYYLTKKE